MSDNSLKKGRYTRHSNKIGLYSTSQDRIGFLSNNNDVVLSFPFKDAVLEAGMSKEDSGREERFLHQEIDGKDIDTLFEPKALTNFQYYSHPCTAQHSTAQHSTAQHSTAQHSTAQHSTAQHSTAQHTVDESETKINFFDENGELQQNLLIKGNNLLALHSLSSKLAGKVKLIYIDPPYNTGNDGFKYNDSFNHSSWLTFMKNRLEISKQLLSDDGFIFIQTDDTELAYMRVLMDEVFGRDKYLNTIVIKAKSSSGASGGGEDKRLKKNVEFITVYANEYAEISIQKEVATLENYINSRKDEGKTFAYTSVLFNTGSLIKIGETVDGRGEKIELFNVENYEIKSINQLSIEEGLDQIEIYKKYIDRVFTTENAQTSIRDRVLDAVADSNYTIARYAPVSGKNKGKIIDVGFIGQTKRLVSFLKETVYEENGEIFKTEKAGTLWSDLSWSSINSEGGVVFSSGKKPEKLIQRIIASSTNEGDIVLDYHLGSGTTCAVAHKMGRRWIGIEQMDYIEDITKARLLKVLEGEQGGISKSVDWQGGGSFVYFELKKYNQDFLNQIMAANSKGELDEVYADMAKNAFLKFWFDKNEFEKDENFRSLDLDQRKELLISILDENQLYLNHADMRDSRYHVSEEEMNLTDLFYGAKND